MLHGVGCSIQRQCKNKNKGAVYDLNWGKNTCGSR